MVTGGGTIRNYTVALMITTMIGLSAIIVFGGSESSEAESEAEEAPVYSGYCGDNVTFGFDPSTGEFTLGGSGAMINYRNEERPWYSYKEEIRSVNIGTSVTSIGYFAFCDCTALTSVIIPDSVTQIWYAAFMGCTALTSVEIPDSVTELQRSTFERCTKLTSITIPDSVIKISSAFRDCTALTSVEIPDSVTFLGVHSITARA